MAKKGKNIVETDYYFIDYHLNRFQDFLDEDDLENSILIIDGNKKAEEYQLYKIQNLVYDAYDVEYYEFLSVLSNYNILKKEEEKECFI